MTFLKTFSGINLSMWQAEQWIHTEESALFYKSWENHSQLYLTFSPRCLSWNPPFLSLTVTQNRSHTHMASTLSYVWKTIKISTQYVISQLLVVLSGKHTIWSFDPTVKTFWRKGHVFTNKNWTESSWKFGSNEWPWMNVGLVCWICS